MMVWMTRAEYEARNAVVEAAMAWWRVPFVPRERWCSVPEQFEEACYLMEAACAALHRLELEERERLHERR